MLCSDFVAIQLQLCRWMILGEIYLIVRLKICFGRHSEMAAGFRTSRTVDGKRSFPWRWFVIVPAKNGMACAAPAPGLPLDTSGEWRPRRTFQRDVSVEFGMHHVAGAAV